MMLQPCVSPSSRGLGHRVFISATGVRLPLGTPLILSLRLAFKFSTIDNSLKLKAGQIRQDLYQPFSYLYDLAAWL